MFAIHRTRKATKRLRAEYGVFVGGKLVAYIVNPTGGYWQIVRPKKPYAFIDGARTLKKAKMKAQMFLA